MELGSEIKSRAAAALPELAEEIGGAAGAIGFDLRGAERCDGAIFLVGDGERFITKQDQTANLHPAAMPRSTAARSAARRVST